MPNEKYKLSQNLQLCLTIKIFLSMDKFSDVLNLIWDFVNHPIWFPAALAVVGIIFFVVMFIKANRIVDRHRAEVQQKIVNEAYGDSVSRRYGTQQPTEKSGNKKIVS